MIPKHSYWISYIVSVTNHPCFFIRSFVSTSHRRLSDREIVNRAKKHAIGKQGSFHRFSSVHVYPTQP